MLISLMTGEGLEPSQYRYRRILSPFDKLLIPPDYHIKLGKNCFLGTIWGPKHNRGKTWLA